MQTAQAEAAMTLATLRFVFFSLIAGVLIFAGVVMLLQQPHPANGDPGALLVSLVLLGFSLAAARLVVGRLLCHALRQRVEEASPGDQPAVLQRGFFSFGLIGGALAEGFCFFALVVYMLTTAPAALLATALGLVALTVQIPTADRFYRFSEEIRGHRLA